MVDWLTVTLAFIVVVEPFLVLFVAPRITRTLTEKHAERVFREKLLPLMPKVPSAADIADAVRLGTALPAVPSVEDIAVAVQQAVAELQPSAEQQQAARAELGAAVAQAVQAAVAEAVKGRMGALSAQAGDARTTKALLESQLKERVGQKYGIKGLGALRILQAVDKDLYGLGLDAVAFAPGSLDEWLEQNAEKFTIGAEGGKAKPKVQVV